LWYGLDNVVELTNISLDEFFELSGVLPLVRAIMMSSSMLIVEHRFECIGLIEVVGKCIELSFLWALPCKMVVQEKEVITLLYIYIYV